MSGPIDEGAPVYGSKSYGAPNLTVNGTNFCTGMRAFYIDDITFDREYDFVLYFAGSTFGELHNATQFIDGTGGYPGAVIAGEVVLQNPIGYHGKVPAEIVLDLIVEQAHVGQGFVSLSPTGDHGTNQWTRSFGTNPHYTYVQEPVDSYNVSTYLTATGPTLPLVEEFDLDTIPSNAVSVAEVAAYAVMKQDNVIGAGTYNQGMGIAMSVYAGSTPTVRGRTLSTLPRYPDEIQVVDVRFESPTGAYLATKAEWNGYAYLRITTKLGTTGTAALMWWLYTVEVAVWYTVDSSTADLVHESSFTGLVSGGIQLDVSLFDGTYLQNILDVLKHEPRLAMYLDMNGRLALGAVTAYSAWSTPLELRDDDGTIVAINRGRYVYDEQFARRLKIQYGMTGPQLAGQATSDPVNTIASIWKTQSRGIVDNRFQPKSIERPFLEYGASSAAYLKAFTDMQLAMYGAGPIEAVDIECSMYAIECEPLDVVSVTSTELGYSAKKMLVVGKEPDYDHLTVRLVLYDLEYAP